MKNKKQIIRSQVLPGQSLGRQTGFRTANLNPILAKNLTKGLYTCTVGWQNKTYSGLLFYGHNSLSQEDCLEVHILNFSQDLYGQEIEVTTKQFLRPEMKFQNLEELKKQLERDLDQNKLDLQT
ncbi:MAG: riboflavin kinase [Candidatus Magasanikbacteria bacterium]